MLRTINTRHDARPKNQLIADNIQHTIDKIVRYIQNQFHIILPAESQKSKYRACLDNIIEHYIMHGYVALNEKDEYIHCPFDNLVHSDTRPDDCVTTNRRNIWAKKQKKVKKIIMYGRFIPRIRNNMIHNESAISIVYHAIEQLSNADTCTRQRDKNNTDRAFVSSVAPKAVASEAGYSANIQQQNVSLIASTNNIISENEDRTSVTTTASNVINLQHAQPSSDQATYRKGITTILSHVLNVPSGLFGNVHYYSHLQTDEINRIFSMSCILEDFLQEMITIMFPTKTIKIITTILIPEQYGTSFEEKRSSHKRRGYTFTHQDDEEQKKKRNEQTTAQKDQTDTPDIEA